MIIPNWSVPKNIHAFTVLKEDPVYDPPFPLTQVHQNEVVLLPYAGDIWPKADAAVTRESDIVCSIRTADCLPILITNKQGNEVAAIHAGWKGLVGGVIEATLAKMQSPAEECIAWIGPAICGKCFEVGLEVREAFVAKDARFAAGFIPGNHENKYLGDLPKIARIILTDLGIKDVSLSGICTIEELRCDSYRRQNGSDQRMITAISFS